MVFGIICKLSSIESGLCLFLCFNSGLIFCFRGVICAELLVKCLYFSFTFLKALKRRCGKSCNKCTKNRGSIVILNLVVVYRVYVICELFILSFNKLAGVTKSILGCSRRFCINVVLKAYLSSGFNNPVNLCGSVRNLAVFALEIFNSLSDFRADKLLAYIATLFAESDKVVSILVCLCLVICIGDDLSVGNESEFSCNCCGLAGCYGLVCLISKVIVFKLLFDKSYEFGECGGLSLVKGEVVKLTAYENDAVSVDIGGETLTIPMNKISKVQTLFDFTTIDMKEEG